MDFQEQIQRLWFHHPHLTMAMIYYTYDQCSEAQKEGVYLADLKRCFEHIREHKQCQVYLLADLEYLLY